MSKGYQRIFEAVRETPWAILPTKMADIMAFLERKGWGEMAEAEAERLARLDALAKPAGAAPEARTDKRPLGSSDPQRVGSLSVIPVFGVISPRVNMLTEFSGGTSIERLSAQINEAVDDDGVSALVLDVNSPGGSVGGVPELAEEMRALRERKPIVAVANGMAASAAYWLAASASELVVTPSGEVGSIGVFSIHEDHSERLRKAGVSLTTISAGKFKTDGNPYGPLSDTAREDMQAKVSAYYDMFVGAVAAGRGASVKRVQEDFGQGRMLMAEAAKGAGMVDRVATMNQTLARYLRRADKGNGRARAAIGSIREFEAFLRDEGGLSHAAARRVASEGWRESSESARDGREGDEQAVVKALEDAAASIRGLSTQGGAQ